MAKLTVDYFHTHSLMETTLSFFAGYDTSKAEGEKSLWQSLTVTETF